MDDTKRGEIGDIVAHFSEMHRQKTLTQNVLDEYCHKQKFGEVPLSEFGDYVAQVEHDARMEALYPRLYAELSKYRYMPEFISASERKRIAENNVQVNVAMARLFEDAAFPFSQMYNLGESIGQALSQIIVHATNTIYNKSLSVMLHVAREKFGAELTTKHVAEYALRVFQEAENKKKKS